MYHPILRPGAQHQIKKIGQADLVIGLPTYKNPTEAARVAQVALAGAHKFYPELRTVLINADAGRKATTRQAVAAQVSNNGAGCYVVTGRYEGLLGQGSATAALLDAALALDAKAIVILDSQTQTITPRWIAGLAHLIFEDKADLVLPRYQWTPLAPLCALNDLIIYPFLRALWGRSVRYPAAPDFALAPRLAMALLDEDVWETEVATFGLSPWLVTYAILGEWRVAQSALGVKQTPLDYVQTWCPPNETRPAKSSPAQFQAQFHDMLNVTLRQMYDYRSHWREVDNFSSFSTLTEFVSESDTLPVPELDPALLLDALALGWIEHRMLWQSILTPENLAQLETLAALPPDRFYFPADLWARVVYDFAVVFNKGDHDPLQVVTSFYPIYQGRLAAFWQEIAGLSFVGREGTIAAQAVELEEMRAYLKIRWHTYQP